MFPVTNQVIDIEITVKRNIYRTCPSTINSSATSRTEPIGRPKRDCELVSGFVTEHCLAGMHPLIQFRKTVFLGRYQVEQFLVEPFSKYARVTAHCTMRIRSLAHDPCKEEDAYCTLADTRGHRQSVKRVLAILKVLKVLHDYMERHSSRLIEAFLVWPVFLHVEDETEKQIFALKQQELLVVLSVDGLGSLNVLVHCFCANVLAHCHPPVTMPKVYIDLFGFFGLIAESEHIFQRTFVNSVLLDILLDD